MVGIYLGDTPLTPAMANGLAAVYVGATLVWPVGGVSYIKNYGAKAARGDWYSGSSGAVYYASSPGIFSTTPANRGYGTINWGAGDITLLGSMSQVNLTGANSARLMSMTGSTLGVKDTTMSLSYYNYGLNDQVTSARVLVNPVDDDGQEEEYVRFKTSDLSQVVATTDGWTVIRVSTGQYRVTAPFNIQACIFATAFIDGSGARGQTCGQISNITETTFDVMTFNGTFAQDINGFSCMVIKA